MLTKEAAYGVSGSLSLTYQNAFSNVVPTSPNEDFFPTIPPASLTLGNQYRVGYLSPFVGTLALQERTRTGWRINPVIFYNNGYPIGSGLLTASTVNGVNYNLPNTNVTNSAQLGGQRSPRRPTSTRVIRARVFNPNIAATRGEAGVGVRRRPAFGRAVLARSSSRSSTRRRATRARRSVRSCSTCSTSSTVSRRYNSRYQPVATGIAGPYSGYSSTATEPQLLRYLQLHTPRRESYLHPEPERYPAYRRLLLPAQPLGGRVRAVYNALVAAAGISILAACTSGQSAIEPPSTPVECAMTTALQFRVGTLSVRAAGRLLQHGRHVSPAERIVRNAVQHADDHRAGRVHRPSRRGRPVRDAGTNHISGTPPTQPGTPAVATTFNQVGGAFAYGFAPANSATSGAANYINAIGARHRRRVRLQHLQRERIRALQRVLVAVLGGELVEPAPRSSWDRRRCRTSTTERSRTDSWGMTPVSSRSTCAAGRRGVQPAPHGPESDDRRQLRHVRRAGDYDDATPLAPEAPGSRSGSRTAVTAADSGGGGAVRSSSSLRRRRA